MSTDTGKARLPALPPVSTGNPALDQWMRAVSERLEVREGNRGNPFERVVLQRELVALGLDQAQWGKTAGTSVASVMVQAPSGQFSRVPLDAFSDELRKTRLYRDLQKSISDASRFDTVPDTVRSILLASLADEAAQRGADIQRLEGKVQTTEQSLAYTVQEITAAVAGAQAGVREVTYASATANEATAGKVAQLAASLDGTGSATLEESLAVIASRTEGLSSQYMLKLGAGNAVASIGLMASEDPDGDTESAFIVEAGRFGLVAPYTFVQETTPSATAIGQTWYTPSSKVSKRATATGTGSWATFTPTVPFGVDATTGEVFINGSLKINAGGSALEDSMGEVGPQGPQGPQGPTGGTGGTGSRGTIVTKITTAWTDAAGYNQIYAIASAAGMTPTYPIKGDIVSYTGGAKECTAAGGYGTWTDVASYINGSMILTGTLGADKIAAGTITAAVSINSTGYIKSEGSYTSSGWTAAGMFNLAKAAPYGIVAYAGADGAGVTGYSDIPNLPGVQGGTQASGGIGVLAYANSGGTWALKSAGNSWFTGSLQCDSSINAVGNVTAYGSSDARLKEHVVPIADPLHKLRQLRGVTFDWTDAYLEASGGEDGYFVRRHDVGVIAQEVQVVFPEIVGTRPDGTLAVKYDRLTPVLIEAVKALDARLSALELHP